MKIHFSKYHGAGNDFILIDNRKEELSLTVNQVEGLCNRHFGIGADGLILLEDSETVDFRMRYFNANGNEATLCGNGGRCITSFAHRLGVVDKGTHFRAIDGLHTATILSSSKKGDIISLKMNDVSHWDKAGKDFIFNTGSPHLIRFVDNLDDIDVVAEGRKVRHGKQFGDEGINVNFISLIDGHVKIRTYERGVEDETLACGTGAVASALAASFHNIKPPVTINAKGGELKVHFTKDKNTFTDIRLEGPAVFVYSGEINI